MGGIRLRSLAQRRSVSISTADIAILVHKKMMAKAPSIPKEEIDARCKSDSFAKIVASLQFIWLGIHRGNTDVDNRTRGVEREHGREGTDDDNGDGGDSRRINGDQNRLGEQDARSAPFGVDLRVAIPWVITVGICITFGALHCLMWHRVFPTAIELCHE
ncbi:hypothetical protein QBC33DRAFT_519646 [Phialemonium atrogriseum]|uniref:Uncharacterized protein n=1 Tax=Phialemonium atrogriseum TaxID=1093897 RepID=A0AAJ0FIP7_9PEZI|nr:uncharacterized protein QBC33DRAFT_519646 [Phialemonium atrogriseum]KAK1762300.1 hypothetical protein QBC33DRAFT_519646 [Phialemonium atrogriseum]